MDICRDRTDKDPLVCRCGHTGHLVFRDRSSPYSPLLVFSLEGFTGVEITVPNYDYIPDDLLKALAPTCPKCGGTDTVRPPEWTQEEKRKIVAAYRRQERRAKQQAAPKKPAARKRARKVATKTAAKAAKKS